MHHNIQIQIQIYHDKNTNTNTNTFEYNTYKFPLRPFSFKYITFSGEQQMKSYAADSFDKSVFLFSQTIGNGDFCDDKMNRSGKFELISQQMMKC